MKGIKEALKRIVLFVFAVAVTISATTPEKAEALSTIPVCTGASPYDVYHYDTSVYNTAWMRDMVHVPIKTGAGGIIGSYFFVCGLARAKGTDNYILMVRQIMEPSVSAVRYKKLSGGKYSYAYGLSEYCGFVTQLPSLDDFTPKKLPSDNVISVSLGASTDKSKTIGLSYDIKKSDLSFTTVCSTADGIYGMLYDYEVHVVNPFYSNAYFREWSDQNSMAKFHTNNASIYLNITYIARFGASSSNTAKSYDVITGKLFEKSGTLSLSFPAISRQ
ncbi:MAG: hypothetical protein IK125_00315 [Lachnospiraceae bacterium]|nr:hypothetical protein [Lachnospiraceae bacterium]